MQLLTAGFETTGIRDIYLKVVVSIEKKLHKV